MAIPKYDEMYRAFLDCLADGQPHKSKEVKDNIAKVFRLSDADRAALLPSGSAPVFDGRVGWTKTYLKKAGLIQSPSRGVYVLTAEGKQVLAENPDTIDNYISRCAGCTFQHVVRIQPNAAGRIGGSISAYQHHIGR